MSTGIATGSVLTGLYALKRFSDDLGPSPVMPAMFIGHGNPMNAIEVNTFSKTWQELGKKIPRPNAILSISAHWLTPGKTQVTAMDSPRTIHDFGGFPQELFDQQYPAPGASDLARETIKLVQAPHISEDHDWGLDHGTWSVLLQMFPEADIPVFQISIDYAKPPEFHYNLGKELAILRKKGVLILGTGNMVHNLRQMRPGSTTPFDWAVEFDTRVTGMLEKGDYRGPADINQFGSLMNQAHPTIDHYLPMLYTLGAMKESEGLDFYNASFDLGSVSMKSFLSKEV